MQAFGYHGGLLYISLAIKIFPPEDFQQLFSINIIRLEKVKTRAAL